MIVIERFQLTETCIALDDSPAGLLAWIVQRFRDWSDCDGVVERSFSRDHLLTNVMLYWLTGTAGSSARLYYDNMHAGSWGAQPGARPTIVCDRVRRRAAPQKSQTR